MTNTANADQLKTGQVIKAAGREVTITDLKPCTITLDFDGETHRVRGIAITGTFADGTAWSCDAETTTPFKLA